MDLLILECTWANREKITKHVHDFRQITTLSHDNPQSFSVIPPIITSTSCCAVYRRFRVSTHQLVLAPPSSVNTLLYGILLTCSGEHNLVQAGIVLQLVATLCDSVCHMPPYFTVVVGEVSGMTWHQYLAQLTMDGHLRLR